MSLKMVIIIINSNIHIMSTRLVVPVPVTMTATTATTATTAMNGGMSGSAGMAIFPGRMEAEV